MLEIQAKGSLRHFLQAEILIMKNFYFVSFSDAIFFNKGNSSHLTRHPALLLLIYSFCIFLFTHTYIPQNIIRIINKWTTLQKCRYFGKMSLRSVFGVLGFLYAI